MRKPPDSRADPTRREFLGRLSAAALAAGGAAAATGYLVSTAGERPEADGAPRFGDYASAAAGGGGALAAARMTDHAAAVRAAVGQLGGIARFVSPGDVVFIKPNVGFDRPPWIGATTSPEVVAAVVDLCRQAGANQVLVGDYSINDPAGCFARSQIGPAAIRAGAEVLLPREQDFETVRIGGRRLKDWKAYYHPLRTYGVNRVIGVPTAKQHARSVISGAMKNWYGLLGGPRSLLHQDLETVLVDLCAMMKPTLIVMDATRLLMRNGPTGGSRADVKIAHRIVAGTDQVAIDTLTAEWLGQDPADIPWLKMAEKRGLGTMDYKPKLREA